MAPLHVLIVPCPCRRSALWSPPYERLCCEQGIRAGALTAKGFFALTQMKCRHWLHQSAKYKLPRRDLEASSQSTHGQAPCHVRTQGDPRHSWILTLWCMVFEAWKRCLSIDCRLQVTKCGACCISTPHISFSATWRSFQRCIEQPPRHTIT
jgi:hypothetical protein